MTDDWAREILQSMDWVKHKRTFGKTEPYPELLAEERLIFQEFIATVVYDHDILSGLIIKIDQALLSYVSPGKHTFNLEPTTFQKANNGCICR